MASIPRPKEFFPGPQHSSLEASGGTSCSALQAGTPSRTTNVLKRKANTDLHGSDPTVQKHVQTCNPFPVPTKTALDHSLCLFPKPWWDIYEGVEYASNQGAAGAATILSRKRQLPKERPDALYVIKKQALAINPAIRNVAKPIHDNIVTLFQVFHHEGVVSFVYEEMDVSLEQVFLLDIDPWSINPEHKDSQIAAICSQERPSANVGTSLIAPRRELLRDSTAMAEIFLALSFPLDGNPNSDELEARLQDFHRCLEDGDIEHALQVRLLFSKTRPSLTSLVA
ncbi:hypothetical protein CERZMDRAFT_86326 [Cercospora zeae-maydis SCOH1-5]|uniref:Uncharacterized protein n=1 Tax=Cercospora zeae-maydis SCOH1-5 TaxID=717836 RepID=A0A6A6FAC3_9PEZI|nr:hypothetical protein CERZMDRAFT_86326 [Cercospora zeae-maydis SCOH1-5]